MSKVHNTINQQVRQECRACHNICYTSADADGPPGPEEGYRCEACEAAGYERYDFDKSLERPEGVTPESATEATPPTDPHEPTEPTEATDSTDSEARPSDEPKSPDGDPTEVAPAEAEGQVVEVTASPAEAT